MKRKDLNFTPGPWKQTAKYYSGHYEVAIETVDMSHKKTFIGEIGGGMQSNDEVKHNAILISRAPEMLEKLKNILSDLDALHDISNDGRQRESIDKMMKEITDLLNS